MFIFLASGRQISAEAPIPNKNELFLFFRETELRAFNNIKNPDLLSSVNILYHFARSNYNEANPNPEVKKMLEFCIAFFDYLKNFPDLMQGPFTLDANNKQVPEQPIQIASPSYTGYYASFFKSACTEPVLSDESISALANAMVYGRKVQFIFKDEINDKGEVVVTKEQSAKNVKNFIEAIGGFSSTWGKLEEQKYDFWRETPNAQHGQRGILATVSLTSDDSKQWSPATLTGKTTAFDFTRRVNTIDDVESQNEKINPNDDVKYAMGNPEKLDSSNTGNVIRGTSLGTYQAYFYNKKYLGQKYLDPNNSVLSADLASSLSIFAEKMNFDMAQVKTQTFAAFLQTDKGKEFYNLLSEAVKNGTFKITGSADPLIYSGKDDVMKRNAYYEYQAELGNAIKRINAAEIELNKLLRDNGHEELLFTKDNETPELALLMAMPKKDIEALLNGSLKLFNTTNWATGAGYVPKLNEDFKRYLQNYLENYDEVNSQIPPRLNRYVAELQALAGKGDKYAQTALEQLTGPTVKAKEAYAVPVSNKTITTDDGAALAQDENGNWQMNNTLRFVSLLGKNSLVVREVWERLTSVKDDARRISFTMESPETLAIKMEKPATITNNQQANFKITVTGPAHELTVKIVDQNGAEVTGIVPVDNGDGTYNVAFTPNATGKMDYHILAYATSMEGKLDSGRVVAHFTVSGQARENWTQWTNPDYPKNLTRGTYNKMWFTAYKSVNHNGKMSEEGISTRIAFGVRVLPEKDKDTHARGNESILKYFVCPTKVKVKKELVYTIDVEDKAASVGQKSTIEKTIDVVVDRPLKVSDAVTKSKGELIALANQGVVAIKVTTGRFTEESPAWVTLDGKNWLSDKDVAKFTIKNDVLVVNDGDGTEELGRRRVMVTDPNRENVIVANLDGPAHDQAEAVIPNTIPIPNAEFIRIGEKQYTRKEMLELAKQHVIAIVEKDNNGELTIFRLDGSKVGFVSNLGDQDQELLMKGIFIRRPASDEFHFQMKVYVPGMPDVDRIQNYIVSEEHKGGIDMDRVYAKKQ